MSTGRDGGGGGGGLESNEGRPEPRGAEEEKIQSLMSSPVGFHAERYAALARDAAPGSVSSQDVSDRGWVEVGANSGKDSEGRESLARHRRRIVRESQSGDAR